MQKEEFGRFFKKMRMRREMTLRDFCRDCGLDPVNISKLERGVLPPPRSREKLEQYAKCLQLEEGGDEWYEFFDLAATCAEKIPESIMSDKQLVDKLPLIFCTQRGRKVSIDQLDTLIEMMRKA